MSGILEGFAVIGVIIAVGYIVGRMGLLGPDARTVLSRTAFFVATPCLLFTTLSATDLPTVFSASLTVTVITSVAVALVYVATALLRHRPLGESAIGTMASGYVNAGNLGIPIAIYVLGDASYVAPPLLFQLAIFGPVITTVLDVSNARRNSTERTSWVVVVTGPLRNPITIGAALGLLIAATQWKLPEAVTSPIELMGALAIPAILIAFGISLHGAQRPGRGEVGVALWIVVALKNFIQPLLAYLVGAFILDLDGLTLLAVVITAALPTAQNVFGYAVRYDQGIELARDAALVTTIISVPVLFLVALLLG